MTFFAEPSDDVVVVLFRSEVDGVVGDVGCGNASADSEGCGLHAQFVPQTTLEEGCERVGASFHDEALPLFFAQVTDDGVDALAPCEAFGDVVGMMREHDALGAAARPLTHVELWPVALEGAASHENGVVLRAQLMSICVSGVEMCRGRRSACAI